MAKLTELPSNFEPGPMDVVLGRGKMPLLHIGNLRFREMIQKKYLKRYSTAQTRTLKSQIVAEIVSLVFRNSPEGGFIKESDGSWWQCDDQTAREKCSQTLRDALSHKYRSAAKAKREKRSGQVDDRVDQRHHQDPSPTTTKRTKEITTSTPNSPAAVSPTPSVAPESPKKFDTNATSTALNSINKVPTAVYPDPAASCATSLMSQTLPPTALSLLLQGASVHAGLLPPSPRSSLDLTSAMMLGLNRSAANPLTGAPTLPPPPTTRTGATSELISLCDQLPDSLMLGTDTKVLDAYCTIMAHVQRRHIDQSQVKMLDRLLQRSALGR